MAQQHEPRRERDDGFDLFSAGNVLIYFRPHLQIRYLNTSTGACEAAAIWCSRSRVYSHASNLSATSRALTEGQGLRKVARMPDQLVGRHEL